MPQKCAFWIFQEKQEAQFFPRIYLWGNKRCHYLISTSWYLEESPLCSSKKSLTISTRNERKKGGWGVGRKIKILACQPKSPFVPKKKIFEREKRLTKCCALCLSFVVGMERETKILGTVSVLYWEGDLLIDPPKKPLFPKNEDLRRFFHFYFDAPSQGEEPPEIEVINEVQLFPLLLLLFWSYRPISSFRAGSLNPRMWSVEKSRAINIFYGESFFGKTLFGCPNIFKLFHLPTVSPPTAAAQTHTQKGGGGTEQRRNSN